MRTILALVRRELQAIFVSPIAYTVTAGFLLICGYGFAYSVGLFAAMPPQIMELQRVSMRTYLIAGPFGLVNWLTAAALLALPALSMRLFSEERKTGTIELLMTSPITTPHIVVGKYLGALAAYAIMLALTLPYLGVMAWKGQPEWLALGSAYLGFLCFGAVLLAIGTFASSLTENQIVSVVLTYAMLLPFLLLERLIGYAGQPWDDVLAGISIGVGVRDLARGLVETQFLVLYPALVFTFLFLSVRVLDSNRWR